MIPHTDAYTRFRELGIELYDHAVLVCFALPCLRDAIAPLSGQVARKIPAPLHFKNPGMTAEELSKRLAKSSDILGKELLLSTFSYFEAYVVDLIAEIIIFHSGRTHLARLCKADIATTDAAITPATKQSKRKLQEYPRKNLFAKYQKHSRILRSAQFPFPSRRLAAYGWQHLCETALRLNAARIPEVLRDALLMPLSDKVVSTYHALRDKRNQIAHGRLAKYPVAIAIKHGSWLRNLAISIDSYVVENYLIIELPADAI